MEQRPIKKIGIFRIFILILLITSPLSYSHAQFWAKQLGASTIDEGVAVAVDASGNTYSTGYFTNVVQFGTTSLSAIGGTDIFVCKTNVSGQIQWAVRAGGFASDRGIDIALDNSGNVYVTGYFNGVATFGTTSFTASGLQDVFVAKYSNTGVLQWVKKAGGSLSDLSQGIAVSPSGDVVITGSFKGTATFGSTAVTSNNTTSDVFVAKLNSNGVFQWVETGTGPYANSGYDVGIDFNGNVYATGQFSDTVTFGTVHNNAMLNAIFVVKYNSFGTEQWFKVIGGANANLVKALTVTGSGTCYVTGEFDGTLTAYGSTNTVLTPVYSNNVFVAKIASSGAVNWMKANGSENYISVEDIAVSSNKIAICGAFECRLDEFADMPNNGLYLSVGNKDIFVSEFNTSGVAQTQRQLGGRGIDLVRGIAYYQNMYVLTGSFTNTLNIPGTTNFIAASTSGLTTVSCGGTYCSDPNYGLYYQMSSAGNKDIFIGMPIDPLRKPYDFFARSGTSCNVDMSPPCIGVGCPSVINMCGDTVVEAVHPFCEEIGPELVFSWSSNISSNPSPYLAVLDTTDTYYLTISDVGGCFEIYDSVEVLEYPNPEHPLISDGKGYNDHHSQSQVVMVKACDPDTTLLTAHFNASASVNYYWIGPGLPTSGYQDSLLIVNQTGFYKFYNINSFGCMDSNSVFVKFYSPMDTLGLKMIVDDTVEICDGEDAIVNIVDTLINPLEIPMCLPDSNYTITTIWTITPNVDNTPLCKSFAYLEVDTTGWYNVSAMVIRENICETDTSYVSKTIYVVVKPSPQITPFQITIMGSNYICPNDTLTLQATGAPNYLWYGPGVVGETDSVIQVFIAGVYAVSSSVYDTNSFGCDAQYHTGTTFMVQDKPQPQIMSFDNVICPNDSVLLLCNQTPGNFWEGPNGPIAGNDSVYVSDPGDYFCVINDQDSCGLVSNTITLQQFTTPQLLAIGDSILCVGDTTYISVQSNGQTVLEWQSPLSGSNPLQTITSPGTYTCKVTACGIESYASITIYSPNVNAQISANGVLCKDSSIVLSGLSGMNSYLWSPLGDTTESIVVSDTGTFILNVIDSNGCSGVSDPFVVTEIDVAPEIVTANLGFCPEDSLLLQALPTNMNYSWSNNLGTAEMVYVNQPGVYKLVVTDTNGCYDSAQVEVYMADTIASLNVSGPLLFCEGDSLPIGLTIRYGARYSARNR